MDGRCLFRLTQSIKCKYIQCIIAFLYKVKYELFSAPFGYAVAGRGHRPDDRACGVPLALSGASYAADGGLLVASEKTSSDHMISMASKQDCAAGGSSGGRAVCKQREGDKDPYKVDYGRSAAHCGGGWRALCAAAAHRGRRAGDQLGRATGSRSPGRPREVRAPPLPCPTAARTPASSAFSARTTGS